MCLHLFANEVRIVRALWIMPFHVSGVKGDMGDPGPRGPNGDPGEILQP